MVMYKPHGIDATQCSILPHHMCRSNHSSNRNIMHLFVCWTTWINQSTRLTQQSTPLNFVGITTTYSWAWGYNTHSWIFLHLWEDVNIALSARRLSWNWRIWFSGVLLKYNKGKELILPWKVLWRSFSSFCVYWTQMLGASAIFPWLALVYSTLQSSPRCSTEVGQWNDWR